MNKVWQELSNRNLVFLAKFGSIQLVWQLCVADNIRLTNVVEVCLVQISEVCICLAVYRLKESYCYFINFVCVLKCAKLFKVYWNSFLLLVSWNLQFIPIVSYSRITVILSLQLVIKMRNNHKEISTKYFLGATERCGPWSFQKKKKEKKKKKRK